MKRQRNSKLKADFQNLGITNAVMFALVMMRNPDLCRRVIETSIGREIDEVEVVTTEKAIITGVAAKSIRLDAMAYSGDELFDVEMQVGGANDIARRSRYYHSAMDVDSLDRGESYAELPDSYVIFIGTHSLLGEGFESVPARYFEMRDAKSGQPLGDGIKTVILDAGAWESANGELRGMLELIYKGNDAEALGAKGSIAAALHDAVEQVKESEGDDMIMSAATQIDLMEKMNANISEALERKSRELEVINNELENMNGELKSMDVKLESANAKLESANAKLESANAKLESKSEELGRMNAELESTSAELESANTELERKSAEIEYQSKEIAQMADELARKDREIERLATLAQGHVAR